MSVTSLKPLLKIYKDMYSIYSLVKIYQINHFTGTRTGYTVTGVYPCVTVVVVAVIGCTCGSKVKVHLLTGESQDTPFEGFHVYNYLTVINKW